MLSKIFGRKSDADTCPADVIRMRDGRLLTIRFFGHASIAFEYEGRHIYVDPVMKYADYGRLPKADAILVTHPHYDHFDMEAVEALRKLPAGKFFNDLCGFNKKNKLGLKAPSMEEVKRWCAAEE